MAQIPIIAQNYLRQLQTKNPRGYQTINQMISSNANPMPLIQQFFGNAKPEMKQGLLQQAKQLGCPDNILSQIQNLGNN